MFIISIFESYRPITLYGMVRRRIFGSLWYKATEVIYLIVTHFLSKSSSAIDLVCPDLSNLLVSSALQASRALLLASTRYFSKRSFNSRPDLLHTYNFWPWPGDEISKHSHLYLENPRRCYLFIYYFLQTSAEGIQFPKNSVCGKSPFRVGGGGGCLFRFRKKGEGDHFSFSMPGDRRQLDQKAGTDDIFRLS